MILLPLCVYVCVRTEARHSAPRFVATGAPASRWTRRPGSGIP